jgi:hypothetical protein
MMRHTVHNQNLRDSIAYTLPLIGSLIAVGLVYLFLSHADISSTTNAWILFGIGCVYVFAATTLLIFTRRWPLRTVGQLLTYIADALVYLYLGSVYLGFHDPLIPSEQNVIRSLFAIGGPAIVIGIVLWYKQRGSSHVDDPERSDLRPCTRKRRSSL